MNAKVEDETEAQSAPSAVGGALRTVALLEFVCAARRSVTPTEIAAATRMNPSTAFNLTRTLLNAGYLQLASGTRRYTVGPALRALSRLVIEQPQPDDLARVPMQDLANRFGVAVSLWRRVSRYSMMLLVAAQSETATRIQVSVGVKIPVLHGSIGRVMVNDAGLSVEERRQIFDVVNFERPPSYRTFLAQARTAATRGWSLDDGNVRRAVTSVSVPVRLRNKAELEYVCTSTMFRHQLEGGALDELARAMMALAGLLAPGLELLELPAA